MAVLSIIVPVYNKEPYIDDCIQAIRNQTYTDFELILINDGSTDGSGAKCDQYKAKDSRIKVIHQANAGVSAARNAGLKAATGAYIGFIDSDDIIAADMYELLVNNILTYDADIAVCRLRFVFPDKVVSPPEQTGAMLLNHEQALSACLKGDLDRSANNKIYKSALARQFEFEGQMYEDILYTCKVFLAAQTAVIEYVVKYDYMVRENSTSMSAFSLKYIQTIDVSGKMVQLVAERSKSCLPEAQAFDVIANLSLLNLLLLAGKEKYIGLYNRVMATLHAYKDFIRQNPSLGKKHKYALKAFFLSPRLYTGLMYLYCRLTAAEVIKRTQQALPA